MTDTDVIVVGFGSDWSGASLDVLHAMAAASSAACSTNNDCTTGLCMNGVCAATGFISHTALELAAVTTALSNKLTRSARCHYALENPLTGQHLRVLFDGFEIPTADVAHTATTAQILGSSCNRLLSDNTLTLEFRDAP
jgi:hypothetical protein